MTVLTPENIDDALAMMADSPNPPTPVAGGTDLLVSWHHRPKRGLRLMDMSRLHADLAPMQLTQSELQLGALTTYWDVIRSPQVAAAYPMLADAARQVGAIQIQTRGTWAGNIGNGSPAADGVLAMIAYDAAVVLRSVRGSRDVPLHAYWTGYKQSVRRPDELIVAIRMPRRSRSVDWLHKVGARSAQTITKVGVAVVKDECGWRVVANSVAPYVRRCPNMESALDAGRMFSSVDEVRDVIARDITPIDDMRSTARYRLNVLARILFHGFTGPRP